MKLPSTIKDAAGAIISQTKVAEVSFISVMNEKNEQSIFGCGSLRFYSMLDLEAIDSKWSKLTTKFMGKNDTIADIQIGAFYQSYFVLFLTKSGQIWSGGSNSCGQCGRHSNALAVPLGRVQFGNEDEDIKIKKMAVGGTFTLCITEEDKLWGFGSNRSGQLLMDPNIMNRYLTEPTLNLKFKDDRVVGIACGRNFSVVIDDEGIAYASQIRGLYTADITKIGKYTIESVDCGDEHCIMLTKDNQIVTFGANSYHQCSPWRKDKKIKEPYVLSREEIGIHKRCRVERVIADQFSSLILVESVS